MIQHEWIRKLEDHSTETIEELLSVIAVSDYVWNFSHNSLEAALNYFLPSHFRAAESLCY